MAVCRVLAPSVDGAGRTIVKKLTLSTLAIALAVGLCGLATSAEAKSKPKPKPAGQAAMIKTCQDNTKGLYTFDQRVFTYGYCVQKLNYYGKNTGYAGYAAR
jgi:hypothetical protein